MGNGTRLGKVRGLGSARHGSQHWMLQHTLSAGNLLCGIFLAVSFIALPDLGYDTVTAWLAKPFPATVALLFIVTTIWHARLGMQVVIEDYIHTESNKFGLLLIMDLLAATGAVYGVLCVLTVALHQDTMTEAEVQQQVGQAMQQLQQMMMGGMGAPAGVPGGPQ